MAGIDPSVFENDAMLSLPGSARVYLCLPTVDMRLSFDRLAALASEVCGQSPLSGHLFVFHSRRRDRIKILYWDRDGLALWYKRLERGTFPIPKPDGDSQSLAASPAELSMLLEGVDISSVRRLGRKPRFNLEKTS